MPIDESVLAAMVAAAKLSTAQLERLAQAVLSSSLSEISNASTPAEQARDLIAHAVQYQLEREVAAELLRAGAGKPAMQNLLLSNETMVNQIDDQRNTAVNALDIVRLENRVGRNEDRTNTVVSNLDVVRAELRALAQIVDGLVHRAPLNWNIVGWGIMIAILAGLLVWLAAVVR